MQTLYTKGSATPLPVYVCGGSTNPHLRATLIEATEKPRDLVQWQGSDAAKPYEAQWVLLTDDYEVIDSDHSPSELFKRNSEVRCPNIVFVMRSDTTYIL